MISLLLALALAAAAPQTAAAPAAPAAPPAAPAERCMAMIAEGDTVRLVEAPQFKLLQGPQRLVLPQVGATVSGIECVRDDIVPAPGDIRLLLQHGLPLFIVAGQRVLLLSIPDGQVQVQMMRGELDDGERVRIVTVLGEYEQQAGRPGR